MTNQNIFISVRIMVRIMLTFTKEVSKGSRFNQIYVPKSLNEVIEPGDIVEVRLVQKKKEEFYTTKDIAISPFKQRLIKDIFNVLRQYPEIQQAYIGGSFLTKVVGYNDIDIVLVVEKKAASFEKELDHQLTTLFNQRFHVLSYTSEKLAYLLERCPILNSLLSVCVSNKPITFPEKKIKDSRYIKFQLMLAEDVLEVKLSSNTVYAAVRRVVTIQRFLDEKSLESSTIDEEIKNLIGEKMVQRLQSNDTLLEKEYEDIRSILRGKVHYITSLV